MITMAKKPKGISDRQWRPAAQFEQRLADERGAETYGSSPDEFAATLDSVYLTGPHDLGDYSDLRHLAEDRITPGDDGL